MPKKYYEDYKVGDKFSSPGRTITEGAISVMLGLGGYTLPLFFDEEVAKKSRFGGRIAPGRLTFFIMGGLEEQSDLWLNTIAVIIGVDKVRFTTPLRAGDTLRAEMEIIEMRETKNPKWGLMVHKTTCFNQKNEVVTENEATHLVERRPT
jgi:acyl dehydratase